MSKGKEGWEGWDHTVNGYQLAFRCQLHHDE